MNRHYTISKLEKIIILALMFALFATLALFVAQSAEYRKVQLHISQTERQLTTVKEQRRLYQARQAESAMVQQFLLLAEEQGVELSDIPIADANIVLVGELP